MYINVQSMVSSITLLVEQRLDNIVGVDVSN